jgi:hypothetical protein
MHQRLQGTMRVEVPAAEGIDVGDRRGCRITIHDVRRATIVRPAIPDTTVLIGLIQADVHPKKEAWISG